MLRRIAPYDVVRLLVAAILLAAAALKAHQLATEPTAETSLMTSRWFLTAVVEFELALGMSFLTNALPQSTRVVGAMCFGAFAVVALTKALQGEASCGCFGTVRVHPWYTFDLDLVVLISLLLTQPRQRKANEGVFSGRLVRPSVVAIAWTALSAAWLGVVLATAPVNAEDGVTSGDRVLLLEPQKWIGKRLPIERYLEVEGDLNSGDWILVLHRGDCARCAELIPQWKERTSRVRAPNRFWRVCFVELSPEAGSPGESGDKTGWVAGRIDDDRTWLVETPCVVELREGMVVALGESLLNTLASGELLASEVSW